MPISANFEEYYNQLSVEDQNLLPEEPASSSLTYYFTSKPEMERLFSVLGVEYRRDDYEGNDLEKANVLLEVIKRATWECKAILNKLYQDSDLYLNPWIRYRATVIACYMLSIRRGNDSQYYAEYIQALDDLRALVIGEIFIEDLPTGNSARATMVNVSSDNRFAYMPMRADVITSTSSNGLTFIQHYVPFRWF